MTRRERRLAAPRLIVSSNISLSVYTVAEYQVSLGDRHASINHLRFNSLVSSARNVTTYTVYTQFNRPTNVLSSVKLSDRQR